MLLNDFYSVTNTSRDGKNCITAIKINEDHEIFQGHFPGRPVTPGVILMQLFKEEAERQAKCHLQLQKANNVKFMAVVDPNVTKKLILECSIEENEDFLKLKGIAKQNEDIALKISSIYKKK